MRRHSKKAQGTKEIAQGVRYLPYMQPTQLINQSILEMHMVSRWSLMNVEPTVATTLSSYVWSRISLQANGLLSERN